MKFVKLVFVAIIILFTGCFLNQSEGESNDGSQENITTQTKGSEIYSVSKPTLAKIKQWKKERSVSTKRLSINDFEGIDLSSFWKTHYRLGYIGNNFQRMYITIEDVRRISAIEYRITGFSQVKSNICRFSGVINNIVFNQYTEIDDVDCRGYSFEEIMALGNLFADFKIEEDKGQPGSGIFMGILESQWLKLYDGRFFQTTFGCFDSEFGDQFFGEWISYSGGRKFVAWGVYRIPYSDKLDNGSSEFIPGIDYIDNGWEDYKQYLDEDQ